MAKPEFEFLDTELLPLRPVEGAPGQYEKILSKDPDTGSYTRLLLIQPDFSSVIRQPKSLSGRVLSHDFWEEVFIVRGTAVDETLNKTYGAGYYACRHPDMKHGPFSFPVGGILLEIRTY